jgi:hypothetical protein
MFGIVHIVSQIGCPVNRAEGGFNENGEKYRNRVSSESAVFRI